MSDAKDRVRRGWNDKRENHDRAWRFWYQGIMRAQQAWCLLGSHDALVSNAWSALVVFPRALFKFSRGLLPFLHVCLGTAA